MSIFRDLLIQSQKYPKWFTDALVCWYDPKKLKLTNDVIKDETTKNGYFMLKDFSKNHLDMKMYGFDGTETSGMNIQGLQFDGVDDFGKNVNQPILTDYTIVCKRDIDEFSSGIASKMTSTNLDGAFVFEFFSNSYKDICAYSYGKKTIVTRLESKISVQSKKKYNNQNISYGTFKDSECLILGKYSTTIQEFLKFCLYKFLLFNRTLTEEEINYVKMFIMKEVFLQFDNSEIIQFSDGQYVQL